MAGFWVTPKGRHPATTATSPPGTSRPMPANSVSALAICSCSTRLSTARTAASAASNSPPSTRPTMCCIRCSIPVARRPPRVTALPVAWPLAWSPQAAAPEPTPTASPSRKVSLIYLLVLGVQHLLVRQSVANYWKRIVKIAARPESREENAEEHESRQCTSKRRPWPKARETSTPRWDEQGCPGTQIWWLPW